MRESPRLLDLFCGAGGAGVGYASVGFEVVGVDIDPQPEYPFEFHQADALTFPLDGFDAIHASPPCQGYVGWQNINSLRGFENDHPLLIDPIRERLEATGLPYIIENVVGAPLRDPVMLCGTMFGLGVRRHRLFETNLPWKPTPPRPCAHTGSEVGVYGKLDGRRLLTRVDGSELRAARTLEQAQAAMGIDWMSWDTLRESIPPAYTAWLGEYLIETLAARASTA